MPRRPIFWLILPAVLCLLASCRPAPAPGPAPDAGPRTGPQLTEEERLTAKRGPRADAVRSEPTMRIRVARSLNDARLVASSSIRVGPGSADLGKARTYTFQSPLQVGHDKLGFILTEPTGRSVRWRLGTLRLDAGSGSIQLGEVPYPGTLELVAVRDAAGQPTGQFDAVNRVSMEAYLPGVLSKELYASWDPEAYHAQAIAARSYALWEMNLPRRRAGHFDLEASQASQAYIGDKASDKARRATADTRGQVLVYNYRVLPAFYSSCSGGTGQDATAAWPGRVDDLAPLRGREHGGWGSISNRYRWGPVERERATLSKRLAAWGRASKHPVAAMGTLSRVEVSATNRVGRPTTVRLTDASGQAFTLTCEELRMASNTRAAGLPAIDASNMVFSSHADYQVAGNRVTITGRGFGHGVGLCQFGAQHMASQGNDHRAILGFYYPEARVTKLY